MKYIYSLVILVVGLSQFSAVAARGGFTPRYEFSSKRQILMESVKSSHPHRALLNRISEASIRLENSPVCRSNVYLCTARGNTNIEVATILTGANASLGSYHMIGGLATRVDRVTEEWKEEAQKNYDTTMDTFVATKGELSFKANRSIEALLVQIRDGEALPADSRHEMIGDKRAEIEDNCRPI